MKLNVSERIIALQVLTLYAEGNFITFKVLQGFKDKLGFKEEELKKYEIVEKNGFYSWNALGVKEEVDFTFTDGEVVLLSSKLIELDKKEKLTINHVSLYEKFVNKEN